MFDMTVIQAGFNNFIDQFDLVTLTTALTVLLVGWLLALLAGGLIGYVVGKTPLDRWIKDSLGKSGDFLLPLGQKVKLIVYYTAMLFVLVAFFDALGLKEINQPLKVLLEQLTAYAPKVLGALVILLFGWLLASLIRMVLVKTFEKTDLDEKLSKQVSYKDHAIHVASTLSETAYWLVLLFFVAPILNVLALDGVLAPVQAMMAEVMTYLPNIFMAVVILAIGWCIARIAQKLVTNLLQTFGLEKASENFGLANVLGSKSLSEVLGYVVYLLVLFPIVVSALEALQIPFIADPAMNMIHIIMAAIPSILSGVIILAIGYVLGQIASQLVSSILANLGFNNLMVWLGISNEKIEGEYSPSCIAGHIAFIAMVYLAALQAFEVMGFNSLNDLLEQFFVLGGQVLLGLIIFAIGLFLANFAAKSVESSNTANAHLLALASKVSIIALSGAMALRQMGLANEIINQAFGITLGAIGVAFALAFGLGGRDFAAKQLAGWEKSLKKK